MKCMQINDKLKKIFSSQLWNETDHIWSADSPFKSNMHTYLQISFTKTVNSYFSITAQHGITVLTAL